MCLIAHSLVCARVLADKDIDPNISSDEIHMRDTILVEKDKALDMKE